MGANTWVWTGLGRAVACQGVLGLRLAVMRGSAFIAILGL